MLPHSRFISSLIKRSYNNSVVHGRQLFYFSITSPGDPLTISCPLCRSTNITVHYEPAVLDTTKFAAELEQVQERLRPHFLHFANSHTPSIQFCRDCGYWFTQLFEPVSDHDPDEQHILQIGGCIELFDLDDELPLSELALYLDTNRVKLSDIDPARFETMMEQFLKSNWRHAEVIHVGKQGGGGDGGADYVIIQNDKRLLVQVKHRWLRSNKKEGVKFVRELNGAILRERASGGIFITSAPMFTSQAVEEINVTKANNPFYEFALVDYFDIQRWLRDLTVKPWQQILRKTQEGITLDAPSTARSRSPTVEEVAEERIRQMRGQQGNYTVFEMTPALTEEIERVMARKMAREEQ